MSSDIIKKLNDKSWEKTVERGKKPVVVMFSSPTCPYCMQMRPYFEEYAKEYKDKILFAEVDISISQTIASRYGVMGTPTFKFFCKGKPINELVGAIYPAIIKKTIEITLEHGSQCAENTSWVDSSISGYA
ncbi:MAG: thioredoxin [Thermoplasmatales archaeon SG8-52-3]|nr:MAG: thioredoxin [Thermoplasmatales archaeon SG8-52-3]